MIVGELRGVNVDVAVPVDSFDNLPLYLVFRFLERTEAKKKKTITIHDKCFFVSGPPVNTCRYL